MREIKFRAWSKLRGMQSVKGLEFLADGRFWIDDMSDMVLMQYTGLSDKNGKEIYEGDVVAFNKFGTSVDRDGQAEDFREKVRRQFVVEDIRTVNSFLDGKSANGGWWQAENLEVIGNIHEMGAKTDIEKQEKLTSALWGFAWELQNEPLTITAVDGTKMNPESLRRAQEIIMRLFGYEVEEIQ